MSKDMKVGNFAPTKMSVSAITCESLNTALDKLTEIGNEWRDKLNAPLMREIGGRCELTLLRTESMTCPKCKYKLIRLTLDKGDDKGPCAICTKELFE